MQKKYIVRLSESEHQHLEEIVKTFSGSSQTVRRAQILLKADIERAKLIHVSLDSLLSDFTVQN